MKLINYFLILLIKIYKFLISPFFSANCRYLPTCSEYAIESLRTYGLIKGVAKSIKRVFSCHPIKILGGGEGFDPVNKEFKAKK